ncbi:MAG: hypothetical protein LUD73_06020 [Lachnospiraceae bacterium]|nr:hypothetical protein [Lachnospiraceae bacterium]MCD8248291.1 hypothetical protein [Lachnospiraceae bacterium]
MATLLEIKQRLKVIYARYDVYLFPLLKFITALAVFMMINGQIGFMTRITSPALSILLALVCSFLPVNIIAVIGALLICAHAFALSLEIFAMTVGIFVVMYVLYFRVAPGYGFVLALAPLLFFMRIPYVMPLVLGLVGGPVCVVPVSCGTLIYYLMYFMKNNETMLAGSETDDVSTRLTYLVENVLLNKTVILTIVIFAVVLLIVYVIRRMNVDYAWNMAIGTGVVINVVLFLIGGLALQVRISAPGLILGTIVSFLIAFVTEFFVFSVDYSRTEYAQFEDDEYYYYVKAVPKMSIAISDKKVKKISRGHKNSRKKQH